MRAGLMRRTVRHSNGAGNAAAVGGVLTMSRQEWPAEGWFYNQAGETCGPASTEQLKELLAAGRLQARQAVWQQGSQCLLFVHAATAAVGTAGDSSQRPSSESVPA